MRKGGDDMTDRVIARVRFLDGAERDVYQTPDGRQYLLGYDGEPVYGVWVLTEGAEELAPVVAPAGPDAR
jgi:hypothetical protein